ncbi:hypothetical protein M3Y97_00634500 [Aphelenchoides bicaudatus]|nr:hypothetical protein M3Y97_00634500 [Aphelenchoides bicaudatus]
MDVWKFGGEMPFDFEHLLATEQIRQMTQLHWGIFGAGIILFLSAKTVAHRAMTFYLSGAVLGVVLSVLFLGIFIRRFLPKKIFMVPVDLLGGPAISYLYYYGYSHAQEILKQNWKWLALYVVVAVTVSLAICYVSDVSSNIRIMNVVQWTLQLVAVLLMLYSSHNIALTGFTILIILAINNGALGLIWRFFKWLFKKPEARPLLTMKEYEQQGAEFTRKELEKLRLSVLDDCRYGSPNKSFTARCNNQDQIANFLMTSHDVSLQSQLEHRKEFGRSAYETEDDESILDIDSGTEDSLLLTDDD